MGVLGSMHCIGMCGGLVTSLSMSRPNIWWTGLMSYQLGRIATYTFLGLVIGMIGLAFAQSDWFSGTQRILTIVAGLLMIYFGLNLAGWLADPLVKAMSRFSNHLGLSRLIQSATVSRMPMSWFMVGMFNGLLPCGLVYAALALGLTSGNVVLSAGMMFAFGLGTIPAMTFVPSILHAMSPQRRGLVLKFAAIFLIIVGVMTMARGGEMMQMLMHGGSHSGHHIPGMPSAENQDMDMSNMNMSDMDTQPTKEKP